MILSPLRRLTLLELRRARPQLLRSLVLLVGGFGLLFLTGRADREFSSLFLSLMAVAFVMMLPPNQIRDKLDGSMAFLLGLPVERSTLARAQCLAAGVVMVPAALFLATAWSLSAPAWFPPGLSRPGLLGVALTSWSLLTALSIFLSSVLVRFRMDQISAIPFLIVLGLPFILDPLITPLLPTVKQVVEFLARPWAVVLIETGLVLMSAVVALAGYRMLRSGLSQFQPMAGSITW